MKPAILKWLGGKRNHLPYLQQLFRKADREVLVEPFVGSAVVFMNTEFKEYVLGDANRDLIELYKYAMVTPEALIGEMKPAFAEGFSKERYLELRNEFNGIHTFDIRRAALFVYLNRFGFNGLCRYNQSGGFNVPFGKYVVPERGPRLPENAIMAFAEKASHSKVRLMHAGFNDTIGSITEPERTVIYSDPPYVPLSKTANFVGYTGNGFGSKDQLALAAAHGEHYRQGGAVVLSNSDTAETMEIFAHPDSRRYTLEVKRPIAASAESRGAVRETLMVLGKEFPLLTKEQSAKAVEEHVTNYVRGRDIKDACFLLSNVELELIKLPGRALPAPGEWVDMEKTGWVIDADPGRHAGSFFVRYSHGNIHIEYL